MDWDVKIFGFAKIVFTLMPPGTKLLLLLLLPSLKTDLLILPSRKG